MLSTTSLGTRAAPHGHPSVGSEKHPHLANAAVRTKVFTAGCSLPIDANPPLPIDWHVEGHLGRGPGRYRRRLGDPSEFAVGPIEYDSVRDDGEFHWTRPPVPNLDLDWASAGWHRWYEWLDQRTCRGEDGQREAEGDGPQHRAIVAPARKAPVTTIAVVT